MSGQRHWGELAAWEGFIDIFLVRSCVLASRERREVADRQAQLESARAHVEQTVLEQSAALKAAALIEAMGQCGTVEDAVTVALELVRASFGWQYAAYRTVDPVEGTLRFAIGSGPDDDDFARGMAETR